LPLARGAVIVVAITCLSACGGSSERAAHRDAVNAYFQRVNVAEQKVQARTGEIDLAFGHFSLARNKPSEVRALRQASAVIHDALRRVRAIEPPVDARAVHRDLLHVLTLQAAVADELLLATSYVPQFAEAVRPLATAARSLSRDLAAVKPQPASRGAAAGSALSAYTAPFTAYRTAIEPILAALDRLRAPQLLRPGLLAERQALRRSVALCKTIESALQRHDIAAANTGVHDLFTVAAGVNAGQLRKNQAAAAAAYNARLRKIALATAKVTRDRQKLVAEIG
jgi:hypothetical protein